MNNPLPFLTVAGFTLTGCVASEIAATSATSATGGGAVASTQAAATICASQPISHNWNFEAGDQRLTGTALAAKVRDQQLESSGGGVEQYNRDGSYAFVFGTDRYDAVGYVIYPDGSRCIAYNEPRYDMYVMNGGELVLINRPGGRYPIVE